MATKRKRPNSEQPTVFEQAYFGASEPSSFGGVDPFLKAIPRAQKREGKDWLLAQDVYEIYKPARRRYPRNRILAYDIDEVWEADLMDFGNIARYNDNMRFVLTIIDVFSKHIHMTPIPRKTSQYTATVLDELFTERRPRLLKTDAGLEWRNHRIKGVMKRYNVRHATSTDVHHVPVVERLHLTFRNYLSRRLHHGNTLRFIDMIPEFIRAYHQRKHRSIGMAPAEVTADNQDARDRAFNNLYKRELALPCGECKFNSGDRVRVSLSKSSPMAKASDEPKWSEALYTVAACKRSVRIPMYSLVDSDNQPLDGWFYAEELQKATKSDDLYRIEKVLGRKRVRGREQLLVQWSGHPPSAASFVPAENVYKL